MIIPTTIFKSKDSRKIIVKNSSTTLEEAIFVDGIAFSRHSRAIINGFY